MVWLKDDENTEKIETIQKCGSLSSVKFLSILCEWKRRCEKRARVRNGKLVEGKSPPWSNENFKFLCVDGPPAGPVVESDA